MICAAASWESLRQQLPIAPDLARTNAGTTVTEHATSWVRRFDGIGGSVYVKTYEFKRWGPRLRALARWTAPWVKSREIGRAHV